MRKCLQMELIKYDPMNVGEFDRVSALIVGMYYRQEIAYDSSQRPKSRSDDALERLIKAKFNVG